MRGIAAAAVIGLGAMLGGLAATPVAAQPSFESLDPPAGAAPSVEPVPAGADDVAEGLPEADPFTWAAAKWGEAVAISGFVPDAETQASLAALAGEGARDASAPAAGAPDGFAADAAAALEALLLLEHGRAVFDGARWRLDGEAADEAARMAATAGLPIAEEVPDWLVAVTVAGELEAVEAGPAAEPEIAAGEPPAEAGPGPDLPEPAVAAVEPDPEPEAAPDYRFAAQRAGGVITLSGEVPTEAFRSLAGVIAGGADVDGLDIRAGAPEGFVAAARAGLAALRLLDRGELGHAGGRWRLAGEAPGAREATTARALIAVLPDGRAWAVEIATPAAMAQCRAGIEAFSAGNAILFASGSARIAEGSLPGLDEVAEHLNACPDAVVHVEGHTDSDGSAELNLALSVARAEAVVAELVGRGVRAERLYAIGYGQSLPVASNDTAEGKRQNRRIVFTVLDGHE